MIQIKSAKDPFTFRRLGSQAAAVISRADAMGLLPEDVDLETLDLQSFRKVVNHIHHAGIARNIRLEPGSGVKAPGSLEQALIHLSSALEESPAPKYEWKRMTEVLGFELLAKLVGVSAISIRRYKTASRATPQAVAERLHFLSLIVGDLEGAYNEFGIRQWFDRKRAQLDGHAPAELLKADWKPTQTGPRRVRDLARTLLGSPAT